MRSGGEEWGCQKEEWGCEEEQWGCEKWGRGGVGVSEGGMQELTCIRTQGLKREEDIYLKGVYYKETTVHVCIQEQSSELFLFTQD